MDQLSFLPLGGTGEIGMNLNVYGAGDRWLVVDCGVMFERISVHESAIAMADPAWIEARRDQLVGIVLTHAHLDHLGAVSDLWPRLRCPVVATPFSAAVLGGRLEEARLRSQVPLRVVAPGGRVRLGPFEVEFVPITHSTLEANAIVIRTPHGTVVHTGDWKLDPEPQVGAVTDVGRLRQIGEEGVLAVVGDSTNATREGRTPSEGDVARGLRSVLADRPNRVVVTCFASNVPRVVTLVRIAQALGRHPVLLGGSLHRMLEAAQRVGYIAEMPTIVDARDAGYLPRDAVMILATGSQGERGSGLARIARDDHPHVKLDPGDLVVFSSKRIPGNELSVDRLQAELRALGCEVVDERHAFVHVSGHPSRDDLRTLYGWLAPKYVVPVHGEDRHLEAHADLAESLGATGLRVRNGDILRLAPGPPEVVEQVPIGRIQRVEE